MEGRVRRLRRSPSGETAEVQTAQSQPSVGMPMEVPLPRKVRVASIRLEQFHRYLGLETELPCGFPWEKTPRTSFPSSYSCCETALADDAGTDGAGTAGALAGGFAGGGAGERLGDFEEAHPQFEEGAVEEAAFVDGECAL